MGMGVGKTVAIGSKDRNQDSANRLKNFDFIKESNEGGAVDGTTVAINSFVAAIKFFNNILNRLIAESIGVELQFLVPSGNSNYIPVIKRRRN